eukprot:1231120-Karenia_brevis.AAC.1
MVRTDEGATPGLMSNCNAEAMLVLAHLEITASARLRCSSLVASLCPVGACARLALLPKGHS